MLDSDAEEFGGHKRVQPGCEYNVDNVGYNGRPHSIMVNLMFKKNCYFFFWTSLFILYTDENFI